MMVILRGGGCRVEAPISMPKHAALRDLEDIFIAHIAAGMDAFARALETAAAILEESPYLSMLNERYASFDEGKEKL